MDPEKLGAAPGASSQEEENKEGTEGANEGGGEGTGQAPGESGTGEGAEANASDPPKSDTNQQRIKDLTSKWHSAEAEAEKLRNENKGGQGQEKAPQDSEEVPYYLKEGWKPESYEEIGKALSDSAKEGAKAAIREMESRGSQTEALRQEVDGIVKQIKEVDDEFDEKDFYEFANKHNFNVQSPRDLKSVYTAYIEVREARKSGEQSGKDNKENRDKDKINNPGGQGGQESKGIPFHQLRGKSFTDVARDAFRRSK